LPTENATGEIGTGRAREAATSRSKKTRAAVDSKSVKSCLKVDNGLLYRTVSLKLEGVRLFATKGGARCGAAAARRLLRVESCVYVPVWLYLDCCVWCVARLIPGWEERACIDLSVYGASIYPQLWVVFWLMTNLSSRRGELNLVSS
jgi:hypothetical protein